MFNTNLCKITRYHWKKTGFDRLPMFPIIWELLPSDTYQIITGIFILIFTIPAELKYLIYNNEKISNKILYFFPRIGYNILNGIKIISLNLLFLLYDLLSTIPSFFLFPYEYIIYGYIMIYVSIIFSILEKFNLLEIIISKNCNIFYMSDISVLDMFNNKEILIKNI